MNILKNIIIIIIFSLPCQLPAQVVINEYSCSNVSTLIDNYTEYNDWVEFYNSGSSTVNLSGYYFSDKLSNPDKWIFPAGVTIPANGHLVVFCSGRDEAAGGYIHTNFKLTQTKPEHLVFSDPSLILLEDIILKPAQKGHSRGRTIDGANTWSLFTLPTPGMANSNAKQEYASTPVFNQPAGFYNGSITLSISSSDPDVTIYYTTDGYEPNTSSLTYTAPITISHTQVLRAKAYSSNTLIPSSFIESNTYFINENHSVAVLSVFGDDFDDLLSGDYIDADATLEYFDKNNQQKAEATGTTNKHGNDSWFYNQRGFDFITKDQYGYSYALLYKLFDKKPRTEFQRIIVKALANDNYPFESDGAHIRDPYVETLSQTGKLHLDERTYEPCVVYMNGQYWGVYDMREKVDDPDFIEYYYNTPEKDIQMLKTWGSTWSEFGGAQAQIDWDNLKNYILSNNMAIQANYNYVDSLFSIKSFVDYFVLNSYVVCKDWLNWNTQWWRGLNPNADKKKWRYTLWDEDATFGHYINYTGIPDETADADPCNPEHFDDPGGQGHTEILDALLANPVFKQYYIARFADLSNTLFKCENMQNILDSMIALIQPEMPKQINKWGGTISQWQTNVQTLKTFINDRCDKITQGMLDCYDITGPYNVTFDVDPPNSGNININSINPLIYPFTAVYYGNMFTLLKANAYEDYVFDHWELTADSILPGSQIDSGSTTLTASQSIIAHFKKLKEPEKPDSLIMPNVFTPNGDGFNDVFKPNSTDDLEEGKLFIFNRWGKIIFSTTDISTGWNGKISKMNCDDGVYYWILKYTRKSNKKKEELKGIIQLIR